MDDCFDCARFGVNCRQGWGRFFWEFREGSLRGSRGSREAGSREHPFGGAKARTGLAFVRPTLPKPGRVGHPDWWLRMGVPPASHTSRSTPLPHLCRVQTPLRNPIADGCIACAGRGVDHARLRKGAGQRGGAEGMEEPDGEGVSRVSGECVSAWASLFSRGAHCDAGED